MIEAATHGERRRCEDPGSLTMLAKPRELAGDRQRCAVQGKAVFVDFEPAYGLATFVLAEGVQPRAEFRAALPARLQTLAANRGFFQDRLEIQQMPPQLG